VNLGRAVAVHCFPGCDSGELGVKPTGLAQISAPSVRNGRGREVLRCQHRVYCWGRSPTEGTPARELEPTAAYRRGVDIGEWSGGEIPLTPLGGKILQELSQPSIGEARGDKLLSSRPHGEVVACHFFETRCGPSSGWWGVSKLPAKVQGRGSNPKVASFCSP
jgi:hypothetical protein